MAIRDVLSVGGFRRGGAGAGNAVTVVWRFAVEGINSRSSGLDKEGVSLSGNSISA